MTDLRQLATLAALRRARSAQRLAGPLAQAEAIRDRIAALRAPPAQAPPEPALATLQARHADWREAQLRRLTTELALAQARAQPLREAHARDVAREAVVERLARRAR